MKKMFSAHPTRRKAKQMIPRQNRQNDRAKVDGIPAMLERCGGSKTHNANPNQSRIGADTPATSKKKLAESMSASRLTGPRRTTKKFAV
jgi:hypothetical protein